MRSVGKTTVRNDALAHVAQAAKPAQPAAPQGSDLGHTGGSARRRVPPASPRARREKPLKTWYTTGEGMSGGQACLLNCGGGALGPPYWELDSISVHPGSRQKGHGSDLMRQICEDADRIDAELRLTVAGTSQAMDDDQLRRWYGRFGFALWPESPLNCLMRRLPKSVREAK